MLVFVFIGNKSVLVVQLDVNNSRCALWPLSARQAGRCAHVISDVSPGGTPLQRDRSLASDVTRVSAANVSFSSAR